MGTCARTAEPSHFTFTAHMSPSTASNASSTLGLSRAGQGRVGQDRTGPLGRQSASGNNVPGPCPDTFSRARRTARQTGVLSVLWEKKEVCSQ